MNWFTHWLDNGINKEYVQSLRARLSNDKTHVFIFLGAGLSFGVRRRRARFEYDEYEDGERFPSWPLLIERMKQRLLTHPLLQFHKDSIEDFFKKSGPLDCAELFWYYNQGENYWGFLRSQFASQRGDEDALTRSHHELVRLPIRQLFTTNFDELIETAYQKHGLRLRVSTSSRDFKDYVAVQDTHLIKLHGSIDHPDTIVLTRTDYARSRHDRFEMFDYLKKDFRSATFLFVGFSLTDPNFTILYDDARITHGTQKPVSYVVQAGNDPIHDAYLRSLGVNTINLDNWDQLPSFLTAINPANKLENLDTVYP